MFVLRKILDFFRGKKRTAAESNDNQATSGGSGSLSQQDGNVCKRARLDLPSDTTLQDLPNELLECILVRAVAMEVKDMRLAKSVWKEKAGPVISRLRSVCWNWNDILTTNFCRKELQRKLDNSDQKTIRLEILHQSPIQSYLVQKVTTMKDEIFMLSHHEKVIVYDRNNMTQVKAVIEPSRRDYWADMAACNLSNCVYLVSCNSLLRITKDENHQFNTSIWIANLSVSCPCVSVSDNGNVLIVDHPVRPPAVASIYDANGILQHELKLLPDSPVFKYVHSVIPKSSGNLILNTYSTDIGRELTEIDKDGVIQRKYQLPSDLSGVSFADIYGRIVLTESGKNIELLDSEFNRLDFTGPHPGDVQFYQFPKVVHYHAERNEIVGIYYANFQLSILTVFRFTEE